MFYYWIVDSNTRNPQNILSYNIQYMDNSVHFFLKHGGEPHIFILRRLEKGEGGKEPPRKKTRPIQKKTKKTLQQTHTLTKLCKSALHDRLFDRDQGQVYMRYFHEAVVHSGLWLVFIPSV